MQMRATQTASFAAITNTRNTFIADFNTNKAAVNLNVQTEFDAVNAERIAQNTAYVAKMAAMTKEEQAALSVSGDAARPSGARGRPGGGVHATMLQSCHVGVIIALATCTAGGCIALRTPQ